MPTALPPELVVLIVEDDDDTSEMLAEYFDHHGARPIQARTVAEARALFELEARVHAVVTDYSLPGEHGLSLVQSLRAHRASSPVGIVMTSGVDTHGEIALAARAHGAELIRKPFQLEAVLRAVHEAVERVGARRVRSASRPSP